MKFYVAKNNLTPEDNCSARVVSEQSHDLEGVIDLILARRNLVSRTDIVAVFTAFFEAIEGCIQRGENINLPIFNVGYSITGVFDDEDESFNPEKHQINVNINNGLQIKRAIELIKLTKVDAVLTDPVLHHFKDLASETTNDQLSKNSLFELTGNRLKIAGEDSNVGLYFVAEDGTETKVTLLADNANKKLIGQTPELTAGIYRVRLKTQSTKGSYITKGIKESTSNFTLSAS